MIVISMILCYEKTMQFKMFLIELYVWSYAMLYKRCAACPTPPRNLYIRPPVAHES